MSIITNELLEALLSPFSDRRQQAEAFLAQMTPDHRLDALMEALTSASPSHQHLVAVLLRRAVLKSTSVSLLQSFLPVLLTHFFTANCRTAIGDCLAEVAAVVAALGTQEEGLTCLQQILQAIGTTSLQADLPSLQLLVRLADRAPQPFAETAVSSLPQLVNSALQASSSPAVVEVLIELVVEAARATTNGPSTTVDPQAPASALGADCLGLLLPRLAQQPSVMLHLITAAELVPNVLAGRANVLQATVQACLQAAAAAGHVQERLQAMQVIATLAAIGKVRRQVLSESSKTAILSSLPARCVEIMAEETDDSVEAWAADPVSLQDDGFGWEGDELALYAEDLLESLVRSFGAAALGVVLPAMQPMLQGSWQQQRAALAALQCCLTAAPVSFAPHVAAATAAALEFGLSEHVRVQFQAIVLLGVLCETGSQVVHAQAGRVLQTFAQAAQSPCTKTAAMACTALVSYCRPSGKTTIDGESLVVPFLSDLLAALVNGPLSSNRTDAGAIVAKVRAIGAVACLAEASGEAFVGYYNSVMPGLLACANAPASKNQHEMARLRGSAIEAATVIGQAIGEDNKELFGKDATAIMETAVSILSRSILDGDVVAGVPLDQLLSACARIASVMKEAYSPYVVDVLPHLLQRATDRSDVEISEGDEAGLQATKTNELEMDEDAGTESMTVAVPGRGLTKVTINTSKIQDKTVAARAIYEHAAALGAEFGPYAKSCLDAFILLVRFKYSAELRATAAQTLAAVFESATAYGERVGMEMASVYLPLALKAISKQIVDEDDSDMEVLVALSEALSEICYSVYQRLDDYGGELLKRYSASDSRPVVQLCMKAMSSCLERRAKAASVLSGNEGILSGDDEREQYQQMLQLEDEMLTPLVDSVGYNLKFFRQDFVPIFEADVATVLGPYLRPGSDVRARLSAVCLFDDCIEHCGAAAAAKFAPMLVEGAGIDDSLNEGDKDLKRSSIYGVAQISRYAPSSVLMPYAQQLLPQLMSIASGPKPESSEDLAIFENAVSALASLTLIGSAPFKGQVKQDTMVQVFLKNLPLLEDYDESMFCNAGLCDLVEKGVIRMDTECNELVRVIGEILALLDEEEEVASPETRLRLAGILYRIQQGVNVSQVEQAFCALSVDAQAAVQKTMGDFAHHFSNVVTP